MLSSSSLLNPLFTKELPSPLSSSLSPVFFFHGWGCTHTSLSPLAELLSSHQLSCHLFDLPGFGNSPQPQSVWSSFNYAERIAQYMEEKKLSRVTLLGHSFGGKVALSFAIRYPEKVDKLILVASSGLTPKRSFLQKARFFLIRTSGKALRQFDHLFKTSWFETYFAKRFGSADYKKAGSMRPILVRSVNEDLSSFLPQIQCPTLIFSGGKDRETPPETGKRLAQGIPLASHIHLPWHDHTPFNDVGAHLLATHILSFLKKGEK